MSTPRIALLVDHPQRDLAGLVLTAFALCQRGMICHLVPINQQEREVWGLAPDFVLFNFLRKGTESLAHSLGTAGIRFALLDTEGGVWADYESYTELLWEDPALRAQARSLCMWGPKLSEHLIAAGMFSAEQIRITGCPRFDFYHPRWRSVVWPDAAAENGGTVRRRVLINTNASVGNPRFTSVANNRSTLRTRFGWTESRIQDTIDAEQGAVEETIVLARRLALDIPDCDTIVRPHPHEAVEPYQNGLGDLANIEINGSGPVQPQIFRASVVIQRNCTTAIEAGMAGVPTLSPQWFPTAYTMPMAEDVSVRCETYADLRATVDAILADRYVAPPALACDIQRIVRDWFHRIDGLAYERVASAILEHLGTARTVDPAQCHRYLYGLGSARQHGRVRLSNRVRRTLGLPPEWSFRYMRPIPPEWKRDKRFGATDVRRIVARIHAAFRAGDAEPRPVHVAAASDRGAYIRQMHGVSVTMYGDGADG
ncbi:MAG TPA: surface carbohydrate biosynthesis protein [Gemmatimonadaceae bacterium]|nr:surface carbohydrate biosynthesis protein [Gemmatimonadaceae bacterium]